MNILLRRIQLFFSIYLFLGFTSHTLWAQGSHQELVSLFKEWRTFEKPPLRDGVPDYTAETFDKRWPLFKKLRTKLLAMDTSKWPLDQQVDWHIVWAEMNGYDFNYHILEPWARDPAFYRVLWKYRDDVPAPAGPTNHGILELWTYEFPMNKSQREKLVNELKVIPPLNEQARRNLTGNAKELWIAGIRDIRSQSSYLKSIFGKPGVKNDAKLVSAIEKAITSTDAFVTWLEKESQNKTGPSGIGKENYTWYNQNVHLVPLTWDDEVMLLKRELARAWSSLKLEEHRNRYLPEPKAVETPEEYDAMAKKAIKSLMTFLDENDILTVKDYFEPALHEHLGGYVPPEKRNFFAIIMHYDPRPLYSHSYHWFELAQMDNEPNKSEIRRGPLLYNIFDSRNEGTATAVEEMFMDAGLYDDAPRTREMVYIMLAQRAARGLGSLYAHANEMTMEEAANIQTEYTPRGWMKVEKELVKFEQQLYMRQPGYGTSYITGKYLLEKTLADYAKNQEMKNRPFELKDFFDQLSAIGNIPISLVHWQMTGLDESIRSIVEKTKNLQK